jgi:hypothetical protein
MDNMTGNVLVILWRVRVTIFAVGKEYYIFPCVRVCAYAYVRVRACVRALARARVALVIQHARPMRLIVLSSMTCKALPCLCTVSHKPVFLKLSFAEPHVSAKGCQGFRETEMCNGGRVLLAVRNLYVRV